MGDEVCAKCLHARAEEPIPLTVKERGENGGRAIGGSHALTVLWHGCERGR